jgi:hypothetical protein
MASVLCPGEATKDAAAARAEGRDLHDTTSVQMEGKATEKQNNAKQGQDRSEQ